MRGMLIDGPSWVILMAIDTGGASIADFLHASAPDMVYKQGESLNSQLPQE